MNLEKLNIKVIAAGCPARGEADATEMAARLPPAAEPSGSPYNSRCAVIIPRLDILKKMLFTEILLIARLRGLCGLTFCGKLHILYVFPGSDEKIGRKSGSRA